MIASMDIETYEKQKDGSLTPVLDCTKFTIGAIKLENKKKVEFYKNKEDMWGRIIQLAERARNRKKVVYIYGHNVKYDFYGIADLRDKRLKIISHTPFIANIIIEGKESLKILDSMAIWSTSLKRIGDMLGKKKLKMPEKVWTPEELKTYLERDVEVCLESILKTKQMLKENGITVRRLYTIGQIAINAILNKMKDKNITTEVFRKSFFEDENRNLVIKSKYPELIRGAYRGALEHAKIGKWKEVDAYDFNGLYQHAAETMRFPDLSSEKYIERPLMNTRKDVLLNKIGVSRCYVKNISNKHGLLQIRTPRSIYIPKVGKGMIGTWTHDELLEAEKSGYEIIDIEWSITFKETDNPYKNIIPELSDRKEEAKDEIERKFWKNIANHSFGKLAQIRVSKEIVIDSIEEVEEYNKRNYEMTHGVPGTYLMIYKRDRDKKTSEKSFYAPIIPALINARARIIMHKYIRMIKYENWLYTGTDSIMTTEKDLHKKIPIGSKTGRFKTTAWDTPITITAKKHYMIGNKIKAAGVRSYGLSKEDYEKGELKNKKMITLMNTGDISEIGKFKDETRNLKEVEEKYRQYEEKMEENDLFIDSNIENINFFLKDNEIWEGL